MDIDGRNLIQLAGVSLGTVAEVTSAFTSMVKTPVIVMLHFTLEEENVKLIRKHKKKILLLYGTCAKICLKVVF